MDGSLPIGSLVGGRWRVTGYLGAGGFGEVLSVNDESEVGLGGAAVKVLHPNTSPLERDNFLREVQKIAALRHQNLVGYLDSGLHRDPTTGGAPRPYLVTELCDGSLADHLAAQPGGRLSTEETVAVLRDVLAGLLHLHHRRLIHRDIKSANVLAGGGAWKLADFGLMRDLTATGSYHRDGAPIGTPLYMAPELFTDASTSAASDVFAIGVLAHVCAVGRPLHGGTGPALLHNIASGQITIDPSIDPRLVPLVRRATAPDPGQRPRTEELLGLLDDAGGGRGATVVLPPHSGPVAPAGHAISGGWDSGPRPAPPVSGPYGDPYQHRPPSGPQHVADAGPAWPGPQSGPHDDRWTGGGNQADNARPPLAWLLVGAAIFVAAVAGGIGVVTLLNGSRDDGAILTATGDDTTPVADQAQPPDADGSTNGGAGAEADAEVVLGEDVEIGDNVSIGGGVVTGGVTGADGSPIDALGHLSPTPCVAQAASEVVLVTNLHDVALDYWMQIDYIDAAGVQVGQSYEVITALAPGQRALMIPEAPLDSGAVGCEISELRVTANPDAAAAAGDGAIVSCVFDDFFGNSYDIVYTITNTTQTAGDADATLAVIDAEGVRIDESSLNLVYGLSPGQTGQGESSATFWNLDSPLLDRAVDHCAVVAVDHGW